MALTRDEVFDDRFFELYPELAGRLDSAADRLFGVEPLTPAERAERRGLEAREQRLQPLPIGQDLPSTRIPGNPYSYDISPVSEGLRDVAFALVNRAREKRLLGDPEREAELRGRAGQARRSAEATTGRMSDIRGGARGDLQRAQRLEREADEAGGVMSRLEELRQREADVERGQERREAFVDDTASRLALRGFDVESEKDLSRLRTDLEKELIKYRDQFREEAASDSPFNPSTVNNYFRTLNTQTQLDIMGLEQKLEELQNLRESPRSADEERIPTVSREIQSLYDRITKNSQETARLMEQMGLVPDVGQQGGQFPNPNAPEPATQPRPGPSPQGGQPEPSPQSQATPLIGPDGNELSMSFEQYVRERAGGDEERARQTLRRRGVQIGTQ